MNGGLRKTRTVLQPSDLASRARLPKQSSLTPRNVMYSPPLVDRISGIWGSYHNLPKAIFYLLKRDCAPMYGKCAQIMLKVPFSSPCGNVLTSALYVWKV